MLLRQLTTSIGSHNRIFKAHQLHPHVASPQQHVAKSYHSDFVKIIISLITKQASDFANVIYMNDNLSYMLQQHVAAVIFQLFYHAAQCICLAIKKNPTPITLFKRI